MRKDLDLVVEQMHRDVFAQQRRWGGPKQDLNLQEKPVDPLLEDAKRVRGITARTGRICEANLLFTWLYWPRFLRDSEVDSTRNSCRLIVSELEKNREELRVKLSPRLEKRLKGFTGQERAEEKRKFFRHRDFATVPYQDLIDKPSSQKVDQAIDQLLKIQGLLLQPNLVRTYEDIRNEKTKTHKTSPNIRYVLEALLIVGKALSGETPKFLDHQQLLPNVLIRKMANGDEDGPGWPVGQADGILVPQALLFSREFINLSLSEALWELMIQKIPHARLEMRALMRIPYYTPDALNSVLKNDLEIFQLRQGKMMLEWDCQKPKNHFHGAKSVVFYYARGSVDSKEIPVEVNSQFYINWLKNPPNPKRIENPPKKKELKRILELVKNQINTFGRRKVD